MLHECLLRPAMRWAQGTLAGVLWKAWNMNREDKEQNKETHMREKKYDMRKKSGEYKRGSLSLAKFANSSLHYWWMGKKWRRKQGLYFSHIGLDWPVQMINIMQSDELTTILEVTLEYWKCFMILRLETLNGPDVGQLVIATPRSSPCPIWSIPAAILLP